MQEPVILRGPFGTDGVITALAAVRTFTVHYGKQQINGNAQIENNLTSKICVK